MLGMDGCPAASSRCPMVWTRLMLFVRESSSACNRAGLRCQSLGPSGLEEAPWEGDTAERV